MQSCLHMVGDTYTCEASPPSLKGKVLLVQDDAVCRHATQALLEAHGHRVLAVESGEKAVHHFSDGIMVIVTDLRLPKLDGMQLLQHARIAIPHTPVILTTGHGSEQAAVSALKSGAFHYLTKPIDPEALISLVWQAAEHHTMAAELAGLHHQVQDHGRFSGMIGKSAAMRRIFETIRMVADTRSTVLVTGESGTGKELVARAVHESSTRSDKPFIAVNCSAIPAALIESELFGHVKGAFTGANTARAGKFQAANGGTLLIDEIGEMQIELQSKLLRVIETLKVSPLGSDREIPVDVRLVASTHQNLEQSIRDRRFREDLFYRLNVVAIRLPPLRERLEDLPLLVGYYIDRIAALNHRPARSITAQALAALRSHTWPGNIRELENVLERVIVLSTREVIDIMDLPEDIREKPPATTLQSLIGGSLTMSDIEREAILLTLGKCSGNRAEASRSLGISVRTLQRKLKQYDLNL